MTAKILVLSVMLTAMAPAGMLYSQSAPNGNGAEIAAWRVADDFTIASLSSVESIRFWYSAQFLTDLTDVTWAIYANSAGAPGTLLASGAANPLTEVDGSAFLASFPFPAVILDAGSYWLEIHSGTTLTDSSGYSVSWLAVDDNATPSALQDAAPAAPATAMALSGYRQMAFELDGVAVPETNNGLLLMFSLAGIAWRRSRKESLCSKN